MKKVLLCLLLILVCFTSSSATENIGGLPGYFLNLGIGTRALGMGRAFTAVADDLSALYWNPAGLKQLRNTEILLNHNELFELTKYDCIGLAIPTKYNWTFGLGFIQMFSMGTTKRDYFNIVIGEVSDVNSAILFSNAFSINKIFQLGIGTKVVNKKFDDIDSTWFGLDLGLSYTPSELVRLGLDIQNTIVSSFKRNDSDYKVPITARVGISSKLFDNTLVLATDLEFTSWQYIKLFYGVEYKLLKKIMLRLGYDSKDITTGVGIMLKKFQIDYALLNHALGLSHRVAIIYRFDNNNNVVNTAPPNPIDTKKVNKYEAVISIMKEIPVAVYHLLESKNVSIVKVKILNNTKKDAKFNVITHIDIKNSEEIFEVIVPSMSTKEFNFIPTLTRDEIRSIEVIPTLTKIHVKVNKIVNKDKSELLLYNSSPVTLLPYDQFVQNITDAKGVTYDMIDTIVTWVTFNDRSLADVLTKASEKGAGFNPPVKIIGFQSPHLFTRPAVDNRSLAEKDVDYLTQIRLIYDTLKDCYGTTYVNQPISYGLSQRIKLPYDVLKNKGNCIELAVLFSSLLESIELDPIMVLSLEDNHVVVGWKVFDIDKEIYHLIETNMFGEEFDKVFSKGLNLIDEYGLQSDFAAKIPFNDSGVYKKSNDILVFDIKKMHSHIPPSPYIPR